MPASAFGIAHDAVGEAERQRVHRTGRRNADIPGSGAAGPVLDRAHRAGLEHFDARQLRRVRCPAAGSSGGRRANCGCASTVRSQARFVSMPWMREAASACVEVARSPRCAVCAVHDDLGEQRVVVAADLGAGLDPAVDARRPLATAPGSAGRCWDESRAPGPRHRRAPGSRARVARAGAAARPAARRRRRCSIHSTRSMPPTSSVTPCSTCSRVFTSRK